MCDKQEEQENVYKKYSIRSEHAHCVMAEANETNYCDEYKDFNNHSKSSLWIEGKLWELIYGAAMNDSQKLQLHIMKKKSTARTIKTAAEIILWYWNDQKEIVILHQKVHDNFSDLKVSQRIDEQFDNMKFNMVIRLLDKRKEDDSKSSLLESYYGDFGKFGIAMVTLHIVGIDGETKASFTVPKLYLVNASSVFHCMFTAEMTEKATSEVKIEDTNAEEFGDFLKAISPKQEHPNPSNVRSLLKLADRFDCQLLRDRCEAHLINCIEIPLVERMNFAASYLLKDLKENLLMNFEGTGILELYKTHRDYMRTVEKLGNRDLLQALMLALEKLVK